MRRASLGLAAAAAVLLSGGAASAQSSPAPAAPPAYRPWKPKAFNLQKQHFGSEGDAEAGRKRMQAGDCDGALAAFDAAVRAGSVAPDVRRDRGLCHEKLEHTHPAIDDFRFYLEAMPDAPDAEDITERLQHLEEEADKEDKAVHDAAGDKYKEAETKYRAAWTVSAFGSNADPYAPKKQDMDDVRSRPGRDRLDDLTHEEQELRLPLRRGRGPQLAPFFELRGWFLSTPTGAAAGEATLGDSLSIAELVGLRLGYELGASGGLIAEAGYEHFNSSSVDVSTVAGFSGQLAYELRFPLDARSNGQILLALGASYDHLVATPANPQFGAVTYDALGPRVRLGWRRLLAPDAGLEVALNAGVADFLSHPDDQSMTATFNAGVSVAFSWGL
jgi:hypothetical protein